MLLPEALKCVYGGDVESAIKQLQAGLRAVKIKRQRNYHALRQLVNFDTLRMTKKSGRDYRAALVQFTMAMEWMDARVEPIRVVFREMCLFQRILRAHAFSESMIKEEIFILSQLDEHLQAFRCCPRWSHTLKFHMMFCHVGRWVRPAIMI